MTYLNRIYRGFFVNAMTIRRIYCCIARIFHFNCISYGAILMLHRVDKPKEKGLWYNQHLKMSSETIEQMVKYARSKGCEFVSLDDMTKHRRFWEQPRKKIAITLDDGYRDNYLNGMQLFRKLNVPYCIYVCTKMVEGRMIYWWEILEQLVLEENQVVLMMSDNSVKEYDCSTIEKKELAFLSIREIILKLPQSDLLEHLKTLFSKYEIDFLFGNDSLGLKWDQIKELSEDSLCTIGNHSYSHFAFAGCRDDEITNDINLAADEMRKHTGKDMLHFAFPFGDVTAVSEHDLDLIKDLQFQTCATTKNGLIGYGTNNLELPRLFVTERNWKEVIDKIVEFC